MKIRQKDLLCLRFFLLVSAIIWGVAVPGIFIKWANASEILQGLGAKEITYDPMLDYWLRMAAGAFTMIGCLFLILMVRAHKHLKILPWFGLLMIFEGAILLAHGIRLKLPPFPFYSDSTACLVAGFGIMWFTYKSVKST